MLKWILSFVYIFFLMNMVSCSKSGDAEPLIATVTGRIIDDTGSPIANVLIISSIDLAETSTDMNGLFSLKVTAGNHRLTAVKDGITLKEICLVTAEGVTYTLGAIDSFTPSNCISATPAPNDADGDGLLDDDEKAGWTVSITEGDGSIERYIVTSDSALFDTDNDGLSDAQEKAARTDPRRRDTDGDLLSDYAELYVYKSHPNYVDSDGDSCNPDSSKIKCDSDPNLWDGYELSLSKTSPTLSDTDGDGLSDYQEINVGGTHPLIADLPELSMELNGNPSIILNITDIATNETEKVESNLVSNKIEQQKSAKESTDLTVSNTTKIHAEVGWPLSASAKVTNDTSITASFSFHTDTSWDKKSVEETQATYEEKVGSMTTVRFDDGMLWVAIKLKNHSSLAFKLKDLKVIAYRMEPGGSFSTVGTLVPGYKSVDENERDIWVKELLCSDPNDTATCGVVMGPSDEVTLVVGADSMPAQIMRALVQNPTALRFEVSAYSLFQLDEWGVTETINYAKIVESVAQRCGLLAVDYGDGIVENRMVATNVYRNPDGSGRGVSMREVLSDILKVDYETMHQDTNDTELGNEVLYRIKSTKTYDKCDSKSSSYDPAEDCEKLHKKGLWMIGGSDNQFDENTVSVDFNNLVLKNDEQINLLYLQDSDGDGIFDREEYLLGGDKALPDSDYDALNDYVEAKLGWEVAVTGKKPYMVYPDLRFIDVDDDSLTDSGEKGMGSDPYMADTDGDGDDDFYDPFPLNPPCLDGAQLGLVSWWDGSTDGDVTAIDIINSNNGKMMNNLESMEDVNGNAIFGFNRTVNDNNQSIVVPNSTNISGAENVYTFAAKISWHDIISTGDFGTILAKGSNPSETYAMFIYRDAHLHHVLKREEKYEDCVTFLGVDLSCTTKYRDKRETFNTPAGVVVPKDDWVQVVGTFDKARARIYINGSLQAEKKLSKTTKLITNSNPLWIGGREGSTMPFKGLMDDIQFFNRALNEEQVRQLNQIGVCRP